MINKKGSHVGIILSFTIFVTSLIFVYLIISPSFKMDTQKERAVSLLKYEVINNIETEVISIFVNGDGAGSPCVEIPIPENSFFEQSIVAHHSLLEISSQIDSSIRFLSQLGSVVIHFSDGEFSKNTADCGASCVSGSCLSKNDYSILREHRPTEKRILHVINQSIENNTLFGEELGVSGSDEYTILFDYLNGTVIGKDVRENIKLDIYAETFEVVYFDLNGNEKIGGLTLKIW